MNRADILASFRTDDGAKGGRRSTAPRDRARDPDELSAALNQFSTDDDRRYRANNARKLADVSDTLRARAEKRLPSITDLGTGRYMITGSPALGDSFEWYEVNTDQRHCTCHTTTHGSTRARRACSHLVAAWLFEERGKVRVPVRAAKEEVMDAAFLAWGEETVTAIPEVETALAPIAHQDPIQGALPNPDPFTPQQWAEWRPPVLGAVEPDWRASITMPEWVKSFRPWQVTAIEEVIAAFEAGYKYVFLEAPTGAGKAQPLTEPVLTMYGFKPMGDIQVGDYLPDQHGGIQRVLGVYPQGLKPVVKVEFNDGTSVRCCEDHLWRVRRYDCCKWKTVATKDLKLNQKRLIYHVPIADPIGFSTKALPLNPYLLGLLLGNACMKFAGLSFSTGDEFLADQVRSMLPAGVFLDHRSGVDYAITIRERGNRTNSVTAALRAMGLQGCGSSTKFVPWDYLVSSIEQRKWLLRGILDTDGYPARNGGIDYVSASVQLCSNVEELVRGLGGIARRGKIKIVNGVEYYRSYLKLPATIDPFYLPRKLAKWKPPTICPCAKMIARITPDGYEECQCIAVSGENRTYLTTAYTVTHNTLIGEAVRQRLGRHVLGLDRAARACYVCTTKSLQDQFCHDFPSAAVVKGKSNYPTAMYPQQFCPTGKDSKGIYRPHLMQNHVSCGECNYRKDKGCDWCSSDSDGDSTWKARVRCPYNRARNQAIKADLAVLNSAYFMGVCNSMIPREDLEAGIRGFADRELVIMDEFDLIEGVIMSDYEVVIGKQFMQRHGLEPPKVKGEKSMKGRAAAECWAPWIRDVALPAVEMEVSSHKDSFARGSMSKAEATRRINGMKRLAEQLETVAADMTNDDGARWIYDGYKGAKPGEVHSVVFKPVMVDRFGQAMLWQHGKRFLCMSATLLDPRNFASSIGIPNNEMKIVHIPSSFPPQQRPIILRNTARNSYENRAHAWKVLPADNVEILRMHPVVRALVHTVSYEFTRVCLQAAERAGLGEERLLLSYTDAREREEVLARYKATPGAVMFAPSFDRGIDLPDDLCRVQIIAKIPFPSTADKQIEARLYTAGGNRWYAMETIRTLVQMAGRGNRKPTDWCYTYITDSLIDELLIKWRELFPKSFLDAVFRRDYQGMTVAEYERRRKQGRA